MKAKFGKRALSLFLALALCLSLLPATALAGYDGVFDIYVFDYNTGTDTDLSYALTLDSAGTARFGISLDLPAAFPDGVASVRMFASESDVWYTLYENGALQYGASPDEFSTGFLSPVTIPHMAEGTYLVEAAVKNAGGDLFYISNPEMTITVGGSAPVPALPVISASLPNGRVGESYSATLNGSNVAAWSAAGLPAGLRLSGNTISGTPTEAGTYTVSVTATNANGSVSRDLSLTIAAALTYAVDFSLNGGVGASGETYTGLSYPAGQALDWPAAPTRPGFTFAGWNCNGTFYAVGADAPTVNGRMKFTAQWADKPDVTVTAPGLEPVIGCVWLTGTLANGNSVWLWDRYFSEVSSLNGVSISQGDLCQREFTGLALRARIGDSAWVIAEYDGTVNGDSGAVELRPTDVSYTALKDLTVTGMTCGTEYYVSYVRDGSGKEVSFRSLVPKDETYQVKLFSNHSFPDRALYDWDAVYPVRVENGMLTVTPRLLGEPPVAVTGTVTLNGTPVPGATVAASQYYQNVSRTHTAVTDANGVYRLRVYPGGSYGIHLSVTSGADQFQLSSGGYIAPPAAGTSQISNDIALGTAILHTEVSIVSSSDNALVSRYLSALDSYYPRLSVSNGTNTDSYSVFLRSGSGTDTFRLAYTAAESGTLTCTLSAAGIENTTATATLSGAAAAVTLTPALKHGVLARLSAQVTGSYFFAWYTAAGAYAGRSERFSLSGAARDVAAVCPEGVKPGSYVVILLPDVSYANVALTTLATLPMDERVRTWNATIPARGVAELESYTVDTVTSQNARFVTQPASTLTPSAVSFCDEMDIIAFTGSIGLDPGLTNGRLSALNIDTRASAEDNTAPIQAVIVNGKLYEPYVGWNVAMFGYYTVDLREGGRGIELPCEYTIYCKPGSIDWDMRFTMTAYGTYEGGIAGQGAFSGDLVGSAVVSRPGSSIYALSTYVCGDSVQVSGTARRGEEVGIYDNGVLIGTARGGTNGSWTAQVPLRNVDRSERKLATLHRLTALTATGVESEALTLIHQADGPELTSFRMRWNGFEVNVGDAYAYSWGMTNPAFVASFAHPEKLELMPEWGEDVRVVFKVYTTDGAVRFLPATGGGPEFSATVDGTLHTSVTRAEALFSPAWPRDHYDETLGCFRMEVSSEEAEKDYDALLSAYNEANGLTGDAALTRAKAKELLDGADSEQSWKAVFDGENVTCTGAFAGASPDGEALAESLSLLSDAGVTAFSLEQRCGDDALSTSEWMAQAGQAAGGTAETRTANAVRMYRTAEDLKNAEAYAAGFARKWMESADGKGNKTVIYVFSDPEFDDEGQVERQTYDVTLQYSYGYAGLYAERISAAFFEGFAAFETERSDAGAGLMEAESGSAKPSIEIDADAAVQTVNEQSGDTGTVLALGDNALTMASSKAAGPLGVIGGILSWSAWWKQTGSWAESLIKYVKNDWRLLSVFNSPCFQKLSPEEKNAVIMLYLDVSIRNLGRETVDTFNWMQSTAVNLFNTGVQIVGLAGFLPSAGGTALFAALLTSLTTVSTWMIDRACTDTVKLYDADRMMSYETAGANINSIIRAHANDAGDADCNGKNSKDGDGKSFQVSNDPSGVVYEGVIENPVADAAVTLYYAVDAEGYPVREETAGRAAELVPAAEVRGLIPQETTQLTDENGFYQWGVPEGLWFVTAEYGGMSGDSDGDSAATVRALGRDLLPVLPPQLDVNIPLADDSAPLVENVRYATDGVYVTFSKYMREDSVLDSGSYSVCSASDDTPLAITGIESVEQGHIPVNRDAAGTTYTRTVRLRVDGLSEGTELRLRVAGTVESYAGTPMGEESVAFGTVEAQRRLNAPAITPASGTVERGSEVVLTAPDENAVICYTTDGSEPTRDSARYLRPFAVTNNMTVKAIAVRPGYADSPVAGTSYTVATGVLTVAVRVVAGDGGDVDGLTLTLGGDSARVESGAAVFRGVQPGSYTLSFAGNGVYKAASETVPVTDGSVVLVLRLEKKQDSDSRPVPVPHAPSRPGTPAASVTAGASGALSTPGVRNPSAASDAPTAKPDASKRAFADVAESAWYRDAVYYCRDKGYFYGTGDGCFTPGGGMTRAMFATVLYRMAGEPEVKGGRSFADVESGAWYADAILWAAGEGIVDGYGGGVFGTNDPVTREQMVTLFWRRHGRPAAESAALSGFTDAERIGAWAKDAFAWAVSAGVVSGKGEGVLDPKGTATRAEVAQIVMNYAAVIGP